MYILISNAKRLDLIYSQDKVFHFFPCIIYHKLKDFKKIRRIQRKMIFLFIELKTNYIKLYCGGFLRLLLFNLKWVIFSKLNKLKNEKILKEIDQESWREIVLFNITYTFSDFLYILTIPLKPSAKFL